MLNSNEAVRQISKIVADIAGIQLGEKQYQMVEGRLKTRMLKLNLDSTDEYLSYLKNNREAETEALLSLLTTHHTFFFREFTHFEHILGQLKTLISHAEKRPDKKIKIWSAACSRGQEVYSLAMFFDYHLKIMAPHIDFEILGTDVDPESIQIAQNGVYKTEQLRQSPQTYLGNHWIQGKGSVKEFSKVRDSLKTKCTFSVLNLLKLNELPDHHKFDIIFCRNVFIYFEAQQIELITNSLLGRMTSHGTLFLGVSESLQGCNLPVVSTGFSTYQKKSAASLEVSGTKAGKVLDILCIDDSRTIQSLLKSVLSEDNGFRVKRTASDGKEALKILETEKFDGITLDLHMPHLDGIGFLKLRKDSTPVIVVSSVSRESELTAKEALQLGALDYVEKPTFENLIKSGNEIRSKIKSALKAEKKAVAIKKIKTLVVDDSETVRNLLAKIITQDPAFELIGLATDAFHAEKIINENPPDLITLDIHMPGKDGVEFLKENLSKRYIPTVMISSLSIEDSHHVMDALDAGAIDYIEKPKLSELVHLTPVIHERLKAAAFAKPQRKSFAVRTTQVAKPDHRHLVLIGSSTGGTEALRTVLQSLPAEIPPILIVQHIPAVFSKALADRLNSLVPFTVKEATDGEEIAPNKVLIAPGGKQMGIRKSGDRVFVKVNDEAQVNRHKPSVDYLFKSVAEAGITKGTAIVLTGMGTDGSSEITKLKRAGFRTFSQDEASSVVFGMPKAAFATGAIEEAVGLDKVAEKIMVTSVQLKSSKAG